MPPSAEEVHRSRSRSPSASHKSMPALVDMKEVMETDMKKPESRSSVSTTATASCSDLSIPDSPRKPCRKKSNALNTCEGSSSKNEARIKYRLPSFESKLASLSSDTLSDDADDKWCALNDAKPKDASRRVRRITRSFSDSEMSEASTIDSGAGLETGGRKKRKEEIQARKAARQAKRGGIIKTESPFVEEDLEEDEDLVDTDNDFFQKECERSMRRKEAVAARRSSSSDNRESRRKSRSKSGERPKSDSPKARYKSPSAPTHKVGRRAGKKSEIMNCPHPEVYVLSSPEAAPDRKLVRSFSFNGKRKNNTFDESFSSLPPTRPEGGMRKVSSFGDTRRAKSNKENFEMNHQDRFNMLFEDPLPITMSPERASKSDRRSSSLDSKRRSSKSITSNAEIPKRSSHKESDSYPSDCSSRFDASASDWSHTESSEIEADGIRKKGSRRKLKNSPIPSQTLDMVDERLDRLKKHSNHGKSKSPKSPKRVLSDGVSPRKGRRNLLTKPKSDRFLLRLDDHDSAPHLSARTMHATEHSDHSSASSKKKSTNKGLSISEHGQTKKKVSTRGGKRPSSSSNVMSIPTRKTSIEQRLNIADSFSQDEATKLLTVIEFADDNKKERRCSNFSVTDDWSCDQSLPSLASSKASRKAR